MKRYASVSILTSCPSCGQPLPLNGPFSSITCRGCFKNYRVPLDILSDVLNDFDNEHERFKEGAGTSGTVMSGSGTFEYRCFLSGPQCESCRQPLEVISNENEDAMSVSGTIRCACGAEYHRYAVPEPLKELSPAAQECITPDSLPGGGEPIEGEGSAVLSVKSTVTAVVMSCPACGSALSISNADKRIAPCGYCQAEVYVPDDIWQRLHPVAEAKNWYVGFSGPTKSSMEAAKRVKDLHEEKIELAGWKRYRGAGTHTKKLWPVIAGAAGGLLVLVIILSLLRNLGMLRQELYTALSGAVKTAGIIAAVLIPAGYVLLIMFYGLIGKGKKCREAMISLAEKHGWKIDRLDIRSSLGCIEAKNRGRDIEIDPSDEYAICVDVDDSGFYLKTEPPGYPQDGLERFTSGIEKFDRTFPIRYAIPRLVKKIETSSENAALILSPFLVFLDRWEGKLGRFKMDWSEIGAHLKPGHADRADNGHRYLLPEDLEPLLETMMTLADDADGLTGE